MFQVSSMELVQEIHQVLIDREDSCHRTCFSLQLDGQVLDNFAELKSIPELEEGSTINVVEGLLFMQICYNETPIISETHHA